MRYRTARVRYWPINEDRWHEAESWSALSRETRTLFPHADGRVGKEPGRGVRSYDYDPQKPSPTLGGANLPPLPHGPTAQDALGERKDVLVYSTGRLDTPLRINGKVELSFEFTADRDTCDFTARLCDVRDGKAYLIADAAQRVWKGGRQRVTLRFPSTAITTTDLRIYLSSSNWPRYERNPHTGADHWDAAGAKALHVSIHHETAELRIPEVVE